MEMVPLEIHDVRAKGLKNVNKMSTMDVYAVVSITGDPYSQQKTKVDKGGGTSPKWKGLSLKFTVDQAAASQDRVALVFLLRSDRILGDRDIGQVHVPVKDLLGEGASASPGEKSYPVRTLSGESHGTLTFIYSVGQKFTAPQPPPPHQAFSAPKSNGEPVMAYPAAAGGSQAYQHPPAPQYPPQGYGYPPPPPQQAYQAHSGYGYQYPPQGPYAAQGYGYQAPPPYGYAAQPPAPKKKNSKFGLGLGAGLLGGLLVGDMVSDIGDVSAYDAGYEDGLDAGF